jgi:glycosyltransferase involved in cell wall biosynthesis
MKVLHVINSLQPGGAEHTLVRIAAGLTRRGVGNRVAVLRPGGALEWRCRDAGVAVERAGPLSARGADLVHGWLYAGSAAASILAPPRVPVLWNIRHVLTTGRESMTTHASLWLMRNVLRSRAAVANSAQARRVHQDLRAFEWREIGNGTDTKHFARNAEEGAALRRRLAIAPRSPVLLQVARFHPDKGHQLLLDALTRVRARCPDLVVLLVGAGTRALSEPGVIGAGHQDDIRPWLNAADLVVNPSLTESAPNAVLEAMSCERPCVVTAVGASADLIGTSGWVCEPRSGPLARALIDALSASPAERAERGIGARARVVDRYGLEAALDAYQHLYERIDRERC